MFEEERRADQVGRYALLTRIATGGMAEVFVAQVEGHGGFSRLVALKRMLSSIAEEPRFAEMFLDEGRLAGLIDSPHVVQIHDVGQDESGVLFIAMELVRGVALNQLLSRVQKADEKMPVGIAVAILAQAAEGLAAAHAATTPLGEPLGIVHRDISPQNVLVGIDGRARVADFGIARAIHRRSTTSTGELKGKLGYFSPEQLSGKPATVQSDVFAMGVVAWETLSRRRLFQGESPVETIEMIRRMEARPLDRIRSDIPTSLARAVDRALAKDPAERTGSAAELAAQLRAATKPEPDAAVAAFVKRWCQDDLDALDQRIRAAIAERELLAGAERTSVDRVLPEALEAPAATPPSAAPSGETPVAMVAPPSGATGRWIAAAALGLLFVGAGAWAWNEAPGMVAAPSTSPREPVVPAVVAEVPPPLPVPPAPVIAPAAPAPIVAPEVLDPPEASASVEAPERERPRRRASSETSERAPAREEPRRGLVRVDGFLRELEDE